MLGLRRLALGIGVAALALGGCGGARQLVGLPPAPDPSVQLRASESRWLLIKNPRFGDVPSEPEYIWVEEDKMPTTLRSLVFGKSSMLASPEVVARYGSPPGGGRISPRQAGGRPAPAAPVPAASAPAAPGAQPARAAGAPAPAPPQRGYVVFVDTSRIVIDLTSRDGVQPGTIVSLRRDRIPIVHPVTGELLGELDDEVGTGKVVEVREKFSVVEIQGVAPGGEIKVKDRVVIR
jgi:hypothetical protein